MIAQQLRLTNTMGSIQQPKLTKHVFWPILRVHPKQINGGMWLKLYEKAIRRAKDIVSTTFNYTLIV